MFPWTTTSTAAKVTTRCEKPPMLPVIEYITEEVRRQGHNIGQLEGLERVAWMIDAWCYALRRTAPMMHDAIAIGKHIEPNRNAQGLRRQNVRVGMRRCPDYERVPDMLRMLFDNRDAMKPMEFYKEFEMIHPFVDGNGRTGKILLNWLNGTLLAPIFPPYDLFGEPIINP